MRCPLQRPKAKGRAEGSSKSPRCSPRAPDEGIYPSLLLPNGFQHFKLNALIHKQVQYLTHLVPSKLCLYGTTFSPPKTSRSWQSCMSIRLCQPRPSNPTELRSSETGRDDRRAGRIVPVVPVRVGRRHRLRSRRRPSEAANQEGNPEISEKRLQGERSKQNEFIEVKIHANQQGARHFPSSIPCFSCVEKLWPGTSV